ncbi:MAG: alternative ribosome rescue aminoacyl-tRNA hydrolase ArfB [Treponemataceae bacterium]|nr:MAG: alternative ribosome rescue aminoacyl-tRNA hydrolase ArfB [Treponemataceae bacterium]
MPDIDSLKHSIAQNIAFSFSRSSGKGGQNVNKVNTKVYAAIPLDSLAGLSPEEKNAVRIKLASRINSESNVFLSVQDERTQERNRDIALSRITSLVLGACKIEKKRKKKKMSHAAHERRLLDKRLRAAIKKNRSKNMG